jgi:hypothetical protein
MGKVNALIEILFRGLLASYFLLFAFEIHKHPLKMAPIITENLRKYS